MKQTLLLFSSIVLATGCHALAPHEAQPADSRVSADNALDLVTDTTATNLPARDQGAWRPLAKLDFASRLVRFLLNGTEPCPSPWVFKPSAGGCAIGGKLKCAFDGGNAASVHFPSGGSYSQVRGFLRGVQWNSTDAFAVADQHNTIDDKYVEGVSITVGTPRRHLWTYVVGLYANRNGAHSCPCHGGRPPPSFVGDSWTCDSGNFGEYGPTWYTQHPLWDEDSEGPGCVPPAKPGWFEVQLDAPTADPIEVRILFDGCDENVAITHLELHVR